MTNKGLTETIRDLILHLKKLQKTEAFTAINIQNEGGILESQNSNRTIQQSKPNRLHDFLCISNQVARAEAEIWVKTFLQFLSNWPG